MNDYEFIKYIPTPTEKYMGIAEIFICGKFTQLFKIVQKKDGSGFFPAPTSIKVKDGESDAYLNSFEIDSNKEKEILNSFIISNVRSWIENSSNSSTNTHTNRNQVTENTIQYPSNQTRHKSNESINSEFNFGEPPF